MSIAEAMVKAAMIKSSSGVLLPLGNTGNTPTLPDWTSKAYPRINSDSAPTPSTLKRAEAVQNAMKALRTLNAERKVNNALNTRNGPDTVDILSIPLQSEVRVWREKEGWQGPYKLIAVNGHDMTLDLPNGLVTFRSTQVQEYYRNPEEDTSEDTTEEASIEPDPIPVQPDEQPQPRRRGRPRGSKNKKKPETTFVITNEHSQLFVGTGKLKSGAEILDNWIITGKTEKEVDEISIAIAIPTAKIMETLAEFRKHEINICARLACYVQGAVDGSQQGGEIWQQNTPGGKDRPGLVQED
jgi:hypothetical protein